MENLLKSINSKTNFFYSQQKTNPVHIGFGIDDNYARCAGASIISFCKNTIYHSITFHILSLNLSHENLIRFKDLAYKYSINISIYSIDINYFKKLPTKSNLPIPTYFRFLLPLILADIPQIYYIDADILCLKSTYNFFKITLNHNYIIAAIPDVESMAKQQTNLLKLNNHIYFNAGVLIINTVKWNEYKISEKAISLLMQNPKKYTMLDQDVLNVLLSKKILYLDETYNYIKKPLHTLSNIVLIHFASSPKPWHLAWSISSNCTPYNKNLYSTFDSLSPWKNIPLCHSYKDIKTYAKYLKRNGKILLSLKWYLLYSIKKITTKLLKK